MFAYSSMLKFHIILYTSVYGTRQSVQQIATGWTVRESKPGGGEIFRTCPDRPWSPRNLLYNGHWVFPGDKQAGASRWPTPHLVPRSKIEYSYTSTLPKGLRGIWKGETYLQCSVLKRIHIHFKFPMNEVKVIKITLKYVPWQCFYSPINVTFSCPCAQHEGIWERGGTTPHIINPVHLHAMPSENILSTTVC